MSPELPEKGANENKPPLTIVHNRRKGDGESDKTLQEIESEQIGFHTDLSPEQKRENMRGWITLCLVVTFCVCMFVLVVVGAVRIAVTPAPLDQTVAALKGLGELLGLTLLPVLAGAVAFYCATEKK